MKGAPERILNLCTTITIMGEPIALTDEIKKKVLEGCLHLSQKGERVLGFCDLENVKANGTITEDNFPPLENLKYS